MEQQFTFDGVAALYDAARPDYPEALFDDVAAAANLGDGDTVLEIGCGTGQATRRLAPRGFAIVALDPGPRTGVDPHRQGSPREILEHRILQCDLRGLAAQA